MEYKKSNLYFEVKISYKYKIIRIFKTTVILFFPPSDHIILCPSKKFPCRFFTVYCNKYNQHFIVTHNIQPFYCSTNTHSAILFGACLCTFIFRYFA